MKEYTKRVLAVIIGIIISLIIAEIFLRIYNPIPFRVKGNKIILPCNQTYIIENRTIPGIDTLIVHTKNSLGFRGPEKPKDFEKYTSILSVGGSTTECYYLSDGKDWVSLLGNKLNKQFKNTWTNNAGLDGQSTFGHLILLEDYISKIRPSYILYLVGCNDVGREDLSEYDSDKLKGYYKSIGNWFTKNIEVISFIVNIKRGLSKRNHLAHSTVNLNSLEHIPFDSISTKEKIKKNSVLLFQYHKRLLLLIQKTKQYGITPVLITQPTLVGEGIDSLTGQNLETIKLMSEQGGKDYWLLLEQYNNVTRTLAKEENILIIDLARKLPKNSNYFYDGIHYSNKGAEMVSQIIFEDMKTHFR